MAFCDKEKQLIYDGYTCIDNKFFLNYLADAPEMCVKVYLLGLALSNSAGSDNSCETIAQKLDIDCDDVIASFQYWEELGLVHIINDAPQKVVYFTIRDSVSSLKKINPRKYAKFSKEVQALIEGRMVTTTEFNEYYLFGKHHFRTGSAACSYKILCGAQRQRYKISVYLDSCKQRA